MSNSNEVFLEISGETRQSTNAINALLSSLVALEREFNTTGVASDKTRRLLNTLANDIGGLEDETDNLGAKASVLSSRINQAFNSITPVVNRTSEEFKSASKSATIFESALVKIAGANELQLSKMSQSQTQFGMLNDVLSNSTDTLGSSTAVSATAINALGSAMNNASRASTNITKGVEKVAKSVDKATKSANNYGLAFKTAFKIGKYSAAAYAINRVGHAINSVITSAMGEAEIMNKFTVAMGGYSVKADEYVDKVSRLYGLDHMPLKDSIATFAMLSKSMGMGAVDADTFGTNLTKLAYDLASLNNLDPSKVMDDLKSGMVGQTETVYKYGMDLTEPSLRMEAMRQGMTKSFDTMTQGEKMALRYAVAIRQSGLAHGDFARTINEPANQMRIFKETVNQIARSLGTLFIPIAEVILPRLIAVFQVLNNQIQKFASYLGYVKPDTKSIEQGTKAVGASIGTATDEVKKLNKELNKTAGIDELNVIAPPSSDSSMPTGVGGVDGTLKDIPKDEEEPEPKYKKYMEAIQKFIDGFAPLGDALARFDAMAMDVLGRLGTVLMDLYKAILEPIVMWAMNSLLPVLLDIITELSVMLMPIIESAGKVLAYIFNEIIMPLAGFLGKVFVGALEGVLDMIKMLNEYYAKHKEVLDGVMDVIMIFLVPLGLIIAGIKLASIVVGILSVATGILGGVIAFLTSPIGIVIVAVLAIIGVLKACGISMEDIKNVALKAWNKIAQGIADFIKFIIYSIASFVFEFIALFNSMLEFFKGVMEKWKKASDDAWKTFVDNWKKDSEVLSNMWTLVWTGIGNFFIGVINLMIGAFEAYINFILNGVNMIIDAFNALMSIGSKGLKALGLDGLDISINRFEKVSFGRIPKLARGGMLNRGSVFEAGENGRRELIGNFAGKTTVMPLEDTDFVSAMAQAVSDAVGGSGDTPLRNQIMIDGRVIYDEVTRVEKRMGYVMSSGGRLV